MPNTPKKVRDLGVSDYGDTQRWRPKRAVLPTSTGGVIVVVLDPNDGSASAGQGDRTDVGKVYVYESLDRVTFTLRATINVPYQEDHPIKYTADLFPDNSVGIAYVTSASGGNFQKLKYVKVTYGTWAVSAWEDPHTQYVMEGDAVEQIDLSVSEGGAVALSAISKNTPLGSSRGYAKHYTFIRTPTGTWWTYSNWFVGGSGSSPATRANTCACSTIWLKGDTPQTRKLARLNAWTRTDGDNLRVDVHQIDETVANAAATILLSNDRFAQGDVSSSVNWSYPARQAFLFPMPNGEFLATSQCYSSRWMETRRYGNAASAYGWWSTRNRSGVNTISSLGNYHMTQTAGVDTVNYYFLGKPDGISTPTLINYVCSFRDDYQGRFKGHFKWYNRNTSQRHHYPIGGTGYNSHINRRHDMVYSSKISATAYDLYHHYAWSDVGPAALTPEAESTQTSSTPPLTADADLNIQFPQNQHKIVWQLAQDLGFTTGVRTYEQPDSELKTVSDTHLAGVTVKFTDVLPTEHSLTQGDWWVRAAHKDHFGNQGPWAGTANWSGTQHFIVSHPPAASDLTPNNEKILQFGTQGTVQFGWTFTDPFPEDSQTAFQINVVRNSDGVLVYDSGKVVSTSQSHVANMPAAEKDNILSWSVSLWDSDDVQGAWSPSELFQVVDPPSIVIDKPAAGQTVISAIPDILFTPTMGGTRTVDSYRVSITQGSKSVHDSGWITAPPETTSGTQLGYYPGIVIYENNQSYTVTTRVRDSYGLEGSAARSFPTQWVPPAAPTGVTVDIAPFNIENEGYVSVFWDDLARDADFISWNIKRKVDEIDPNTGAVLDPGDWELVYQDYDIGPLYEWRDYYAPSGYRVEYLVTQVVDRFGDQLESENVVGVAVVPESDGYWLIEPLGPEETADSFRLALVTSDQYTDEYEEESFTIIGRGRHFDRGDRLGATGSLTAQIRDTTNYTARQKKKRLELLKSENRTLYLRNPFGDIFRVHVGNLDITRIAGVGLSEFVDVTIPYSEVGE